MEIKAEFRSRIFGDFSYAIIDLIKTITSQGISKKGCYFTLIIITAASIEWIINTLNNDIPPPQKFDFLKWHLKSLKGNITGLFEDDVVAVDEIFIVRDVLVHGHIYDYNIDWEDGLKKDIAIVSSLYWDKKFNQNVDGSSLKTKILNLNVMPDNLDENDVKIVLWFYIKLLRALSKDTKYWKLFSNLLNSRISPTESFEIFIENYLRLV